MTHAPIRDAGDAGPLWEPGRDPIGLYVHVPFCRAICTYCGFAKGRYDAGQAEHWLDALEAETVLRARNTWRGHPRVDTVFLGGGTPSTLTPAQWSRLGGILHTGFEITPGAEFTSEANPESFTPEAAVAMAAAGVNRLSLGVQSLDPAELSMMGRIHGVADARAAVEAARRAGIDNINLDLMFGLPDQGEPAFRSSLEGMLDLEPDHVSAYCLSLEPGTPLTADVECGTRPLPDDARSRRMYDHLVSRMEQAGYERYEICNFARPGRACRHNLRYWTRNEFIGLGPSAHSLLAGRRWANSAAPDRWAEGCHDAAAAPRPHPVPVETARFEWIFLRLRLTRGFSIREFESVWGVSFHRIHGRVAARLIEAGLLEEADGRVRLTPGAFFVSDGVLAEFAPDR